MKGAMMNTQQQIDLNHNTAQCIHTTSNWGETIYRNICSGSSAVVPWGSVDYMFGIILASLGAFLLLLLLIMLIRVVMD